LGFFFQQRALESAIVFFPPEEKMPDNYSKNDAEIQQYRTPPAAKEAEDAVLGALLLDNKVFDLIGGRIDVEDFYDYGNRLIFENIKKLIGEGRPADILTVHDLLREAGLETETGGMEYLNRIADYSPGAANIVRYAEIIRDRSTRRRLITAGNEIVSDALNPGAREAKDLLDEAQAKMLRINEELAKSGSGFQKIDSVLADYTTHLRELSEMDNPGMVYGVGTGFPDLDRMTNGMHEGELIIVAGRPAMGKTAFALNIALHVGANQALPVGIFSMEMSAEQIAGRLLSALGEIPAGDLKTGQLGNNWRSFYNAAEQLEKSPIFIDDTSGLSILSLRSRARQLLNRVGGKLGLIVVDYLQLMSGESSSRGGDQNRASEIAEISRGLKGLARELKVPIIALSQIKRDVDNRPNKRPLMSDLRESGSIEQDADVIMFLYRPAAYQRKEDSDDPDAPAPAEEPANASEAELIIGKQRSGPTGTIPLIFQGAYTRFVSRATDMQMQAGY